MCPAECGEVQESPTERTGRNHGNGWIAYWCTWGVSDVCGGAS